MEEEEDSCVVMTDVVKGNMEMEALENDLLSLQNLYKTIQEENDNELKKLKERNQK